MTQNKKFKKLVRARMKQTGETYMQARRALGGDSKRSEETTKLRRLGFWRDAAHPDYPDPLDMVDASWDPEQRAKVLEHLQRGHVLLRHLMDPLCRLGCGAGKDKAVHLQFFEGMDVRNRDLEWPERWKARRMAAKRAEEANMTGRKDVQLGRSVLTDGVYVWPEDLIHYVDEHNVKLPWAFIEHVLANPLPAKSEDEHIHPFMSQGDPKSWDDFWWKVATKMTPAEKQRGKVTEEFVRSVEIESPFPAGWYWNDAEYPEEGSTGPYKTREDAEAAAKLADYELEDVAFWEQADGATAIRRHMAEQIQRQIRDVAREFEGETNAAGLRERLKEMLSVQLSQMRDRLETSGVKSPPAGDVEIVPVEPSTGDLERKTLRFTVRIKDPEKYPQFVRDLVDEGLLPPATLTGLEVRERH